MRTIQNFIPNHTINKVWKENKDIFRLSKTQKTHLSQEATGGCAPLNQKEQNKEKSEKQYPTRKDRQ